MIHQYKQNGYNIVLDVFSGSVHVVDDVAYDIIAGLDQGADEDALTQEILRAYPDVTEADARECISDVNALKAAGKLFTEDEFAPLARAYRRDTGIVKALCLHVAHTCNLNCEYCFASQGKFHGQRALMSFEVGKQALDFLIAHSGNHVNLEVDFFGGEPLMNWDVVKRLVAYGRSQENAHGKRFRFTLTTNGVLVDDEVMDFCDREMYNIVMSLDGRKEVHDHLRVHMDGRGSYDEIVPKFQKWAEKRGQKGYFVRGTFTHFNPDFVSDVLHMADLGFTQLSMEPVVCAPGEEYALTDADLPVVLSEYERLATEMLARSRAGKPFQFYHYMIDLGHGPCIYKRVAGCGSGTEYMAVTPWGELFPCHQFVGEPKYSMGDVFTGVTNTALRDEFASCNVYARPECENCWAKLFCSGGCAANACHATGSIRGVYEYGCKLFRKRIECAIMLKAAQAENGK